MLSNRVPVTVFLQSCRLYQNHFTYHEIMVYVNDILRFFFQSFRAYLMRKKNKLHTCTDNDGSTEIRIVYVSVFEQSEGEGITLHLSKRISHSFVEHTQLTLLRVFQNLRFHCLLSAFNKTGNAYSSSKLV